uniref:Protein DETOXIFICATION n=1 Tax=Oryza glumipatula TaxID=40148 RepID=A0A0E0B4F7_9ORYZ
MRCLLASGGGGGGEGERRLSLPRESGGKRSRRRRGSEDPRWRPGAPAAGVRDERAAAVAASEEEASFPSSGEGLTTRLLRGARAGGGSGGCCSDVGVGVGLQLRRAPVGRVVHLLLLTVSVPVAFLWARMEPLLLLCGQDAAIAAAAQRYILFRLPDLLFLSLLYPLRIYLRVQLINLPLTACAALVVAVHLPINHLLVSVLGLGIEGVALASAWANLNLVPFLPRLRLRLLHGRRRRRRRRS